jgi:iron complex outermembrane receptor protein
MIVLLLSMLAGLSLPGAADTDTTVVRDGIASASLDSIAVARDSVVLQLPPVEVERQRLMSDARRRLPTAFVTDLTPRRDARAVESLTDVLSEAAGVKVDAYGGLGAYATVSVRGAPAGQVAIYLDGVPLSSAAHGVVNLSDLPVGVIDHVEVYRGLSPLGFGIATPGGAINLVTRTGGEARELRVARGAFGTWDALGTLGARRGRLATLLHAGVRSSRGDFPYLDDNGTPYNTADDSVHARANDHFDALNGLASATWTPAPGITLLAREDVFRKSQGVPGRGAVPTRTAGLELLRSMSHVELSTAAGRWRPRARLLGALDVERSRNTDPNGELGYGRHVTDDHLATRTLALDLEWPELIPRVTLLASGELHGEWQTLRDTADGVADPPQSRRIQRGASLGVRLQPLGPWLTLHGATRWDRIEDRLHSTGIAGWPADLSSSRELDSPQAGVRIVLPLGAELRGNVARVARAPGFEELFGRQGSVIGFPGLKPERGENWDAGAAWSHALPGSRRAAVEWSHFESRTHDLVFYQAVFSYVRPVNLAKAYVRGEELSARLAASRGLSGSLAVTWQSAINQAPVPFWNGRQLPLRPGRQASLRLDWRRSGFRAGAEVQYLAADWLDPSNRSFVAERTLVGASLAAPLPGPLRIVFEGRNLGDRRVMDVAGYPLPGRMLSVALDAAGGAGTSPTEGTP